MQAIFLASAPKLQERETSLEMIHSAWVVNNERSFPKRDFGTFRFATTKTQPY